VLCRVPPLRSVTPAALELTPLVRSAANEASAATTVLRDVLATAAARAPIPLYLPALTDTPQQQQRFDRAFFYRTGVLTTEFGIKRPAPPPAPPEVPAAPLGPPAKKARFVPPPPAPVPAARDRQQFSLAAFSLAGALQKRAATLTAADMARLCTPTALRDWTGSAAGADAAAVCAALLPEARAHVVTVARQLLADDAALLSVQQRRSLERLLL
jgi:hypothetical protein